MNRFILGVGSQKSGTTWLHEYMRNGVNVRMGPVKEYHIWDAMHLPACKKFRVERKQASHNPAKKIRRAMQRKPGFYFEFFKNILSQPGIEITSDITPSYSGLGRDVFSSIRSSFDNNAIDCKAVFLMRDPVERCISSLAMRMARKEKMNKQESDPRDDLLVFSTSENCMLRTRYDRTIGELSAGFGRNDIYFGIFEEMFLPKNIEHISRFIGISAKPELSKVKVNSATASVAISEDSRAAVAEHYREVYEYMADFMPQTRELWGGFKYL